MFFLDISTWWADLSGLQKVFWGIASIFSILFIIQFVLSLIGLDFDSDVDIDVDVDGGADMEAGGIDADFALFSARSVTAFFTFFGWTGVLILNAGGSGLSAILFSALSGGIAMFIVAYMFFWFAKLTEVGNLDINHAMFNEAKVYIPIPAYKNGRGKVSVIINGSLREMEAVTDGDALPTGMTVRVVEILDKEVLLVEKADFLLDV